MTPQEFRQEALKVCEQIGKDAAISASIYTKEHMGEELFGALEFAGAGVRARAATFEALLEALSTEWRLHGEAKRKEAIEAARATLAALEAAQ